MKLMQQLDELGQEIYSEVVEDLHTAESWINQHFGSPGLPDGHKVVITEKPEVGNVVAAE